MNLVTFSWILVGNMVLYPSKLILLLSSYIKSSVKLRGPVPCMPMPWQHRHHALQMRLYSWDLLQFPFFSTFLLSHHLNKGSSLSHKHHFKTLLAYLCTFLQTLILPFYCWCWSEFASCCVASVILCQSLLRTVDCQSITPAFWKLLVILQTHLSGFIFTAFMICLSSTTAVFSAGQVVVVCWGFPNSWFLHALCFC